MPSFLLHRPPGRLCMALACVLSLCNTVSAIKGEAKKEKGVNFLSTGITGSVLKEEWKGEGLAFLASTELPAKSVDLSALNLTEVVNRMLSRALKDSRRFFSLLSITSYSSFAFHKVSLAIYNISNLKTVDPAKFPTRFCYCLSNRTNDLSDFTALLVDVVGNSTGSLTEVFKSTSLLSVTQTDESDCIFICVMAGKAGRNLSDFWEVAEKSPVVNYTFTSGVSGVLGAATRETARTSKPITQVQQMLPRTSPAHRESTLRTALWRKTTTVSVGELTGHTDQLPPMATVTWSTSSLTLPALELSSECINDCGFQHAATRRVPETPQLPANSQTQASTPSMPRAQTTEEQAHGGPPWETHASTPTSAEAQEPRSTGSFLRPAGIMGVASSTTQHNPTSGTVTSSTQTLSPTKAPAPKNLQTGDALAEWPFTPGKEVAPAPAPHQGSRCPQLLLKEGTMTAAPITLAIQKFNPCLMELCRFFQQCLCGGQRRNPTAESLRYCLEYYSWFLKNATFICQKVKRVSHSRTLKQKCLENICKLV
ncbi:PREDICTED: HERV-H LTR-associating protein 1 [Chinchilla lanigera]|uniref:HERV-H LTR-associating protein 1 n=1 Tax=Chinchilla lanigera TaxID=34839 RepID=UPI00038EC334|nr:PREDICTED: HERV-H LTR-associating protein 1 [Chinchilla lanigera]